MDVAISWSFCKGMKSRFILICCLASLLTGIPATPAKAQLTDQPKGIWFKNTKSIINRFAYSQAILWPSSIGGHLYLYIREDNLGNLSRIVTLKTYKRTFTLPPVWDNDSISWNYGVHPIMGSFSYLAYRNKRAHWAEAFAGAAINSAIYEYLIAGGTQQPSINDLIVSPILGSLLGEGIYQLKKRLLKDHHLNVIEKIAITITDPFEVFYYGFKYSKICKVNYR
ncbi:MAG: DUF3943 domain-containing protein [Porphyromonadaceae bacterium]|nr:MAG: DUF3943 domain-containing protein [Porphyromonadaceae bacterium]